MSTSMRRRSSVLPSSTASAKLNGAPPNMPARPTIRWPRLLKQVAIGVSLLGGFMFLLNFATTSSSSVRVISWSPTSASSNASPQMCPECNTTQPGGYLASPSFSKVDIPTRSEVRRSKPESPSVARYLLHHIVIEPVMHKIWLSWETAGKLLVNYFTHPDSLLAYSFKGLQLDTPTLYMYTRTGPGGKLANVEKRIKYFSRHVEAVRAYDELIAEKGFLDGVSPRNRQLIWIVVEDNAQIDTELASYLRNTSIPYIYFAHGPTNWLGVAQWNAVDRAVDILRSTFYADGPVINVDDDSRILPELLRRVWRVQRAITWPVGNLGPQWEGLMCKNGKQDYWRLGGLPERVFPLDMNGFAINSSMIGSQGPIAPPYYVDFDLTGAETRFLQRIYSKREEIECLCDDTIAEDCFVSWHNWEEQPERNVPGLTA